MRISLFEFLLCWRKINFYSRKLAQESCKSLCFALNVRSKLFRFSVRERERERKRAYREETYFDFVSFVCTHYEIMGYSAWLEFTGHAKGESVTSGLAGTLSHHERPFRLLAQYFQRYLSKITNCVNNKGTEFFIFFFFSRKNKGI